MSFATLGSAISARFAILRGLLGRAFAAVPAGLAVLLFSLPAQAVPERRVALVIGNSAYTAVPRLANPQRDATAISAALKRLGFEVVEGYDLRMDEMTGIVREFAQKLDGAKAGVVYYAGHGIAVGDENYLIPVDASLKSEADLDFRAVNVQLILRQMQRDERVNVLILDACRDNPFTTQLAARSRSVSRGLTAIETQSASGILIAFATDPRATALDGEKDGNSPFTSALLKHIETPEVSITTVMDRVRADVWESTGKKQKPWTNSSIIGEFKLNPTLKLAAVDPSVTIKAIDGTVPAPAAPAPVGLDRAQMDVRMWETAERGNTAGDYKAYLDAFPTGQFAAFAKNRLARLEPAAPVVAALPAAVGAAALSSAAVAALPASRETGQAVADAAMKGEVASAETEAALKLSAKDRRELQRRLSLAGFKPGKTSPNFGPSQRNAIKQWQTTRALAATGFLAPMQLKALRAQTEPAYQRALAEDARPAPAPRATRAVAREPAEPQVRGRGVVYERDPVIRRDLERERAGGGSSATGAAIFGGIVGGAIGGALGGGFRR
ncbi:MAG: caspase family protein [Bosea sp. (in: a-proteobacteria)]|uniref:caspase family protein n=2 Tax=Bosea sp. (in: a-proteobacteria) TaxID=1871050 RepID=UPI000ACD9A18|nr:caspase family protein [Bosea sp. (in: a-proteobacteria)]MDP3602718.1 caspase family protein [Bosea sp. (in: a-proteobacteria)]